MLTLTMLHVPDLIRSPAEPHGKEVRGAAALAAVPSAISLFGNRCRRTPTHLGSRADAADESCPATGPPATILERNGSTMAQQTRHRRLRATVLTIAAAGA